VLFTVSVSRKARFFAPSKRRCVADAARLARFFNHFFHNRWIPVFFLVAPRTLTNPPFVSRLPHLLFPHLQAAKTSTEYAELYFPGVSNKFSGALPKRAKTLHKKALMAITEDGFSFFGSKRKYTQKGWPRGFEFGTHRVARKLRARDWENRLGTGFAW
jgi:hypothetical protein